LQTPKELPRFRGKPLKKKLIIKGKKTKKKWKEKKAGLRHLGRYPKTAVFLGKLT